MKDFTNSQHTCTCDDGCNCGYPHHEAPRLIPFSLGNETYQMAPDEIAHLKTLIDDTSDPNWLANLQLLKDYTTIANVFFTLSRIDEAWDVITEHKEDIDFNSICGTDPDKPSPFFQIKRDAQDVYKYMHDNTIIDDYSYAYFQVIGGKLTDEEFWTKQFEGKTVSERLMFINESFNGTNPFELGLVVLGDEESNLGSKLIFGEEDIDLIGPNLNSILDDDEKLDDFIIGKHPGVFFDYSLIISLMETKHLDFMNYPKYFNILLQMTISDKFDTNHVWDTAWETIGMRIRELTVDSAETLKSFIKSKLCKHLYDEMKSARLDVIAIKEEFKTNAEGFDQNEIKEMNHDLDVKNNIVNMHTNIIQTILLNSVEFMNYPYTYLKMLKDVTGYNLMYTNAIDASTCIMEKNYSYLLSYSLLDCVNCDRFIIKYPFPGGMNCIYDKNDNMIFINGESKPFDESDLDEFEPMFEYAQTGEVPVEFASSFENSQDAEEICIAVNEFYNRIQTFLG